jgi:hypothetical protein
VLEDASLNNAGDSKIIYVPIGLETAKKYRKGLLKLHQYQAKTRSIDWPSPRDIDGLWTAIKEYGHHLLYDQVLTNPDRAAHCIIRDSYKPGQLLKMLKSLWLSNHKTSIRELVSISLRHHMLLRDEDLRYLNFADCFSTVIPARQHRGTQEAIAVVFYMDKGKTFKQNDFKFACAMRHENIFRCPVSAFAFFLFSLFQVCK